LPFKNYINLFITSADVLHRWALPVISLKRDANPGRLNMISCEFDMCGLFYGQCSELCGANHSFIPICVEVTSPSLFYN
jgi:heme/copper-type cytochrome/quinol oxidase subunit 2